MENIQKMFAAVKALISHNEKILLVKESSKYSEGTQEGKFDVIGGRINPGEKIEEALMREVKEETGLQVKIKEAFFVNEVFPIVKGEKWQIIRIFFKCETDQENVHLSQDHDKYIWINPKDYAQYPIIENLIPVFEEYLKIKNR